MKRNKKIFYASLLLLSAFFSSCSTKANEENNDITGNTNEITVSSEITTQSTTSSVAVTTEAIKIEESNNDSYINGKVVFEADFNGDSLQPSQFYTWDGRVYENAVYDSLKNISCNDGILILKSMYNSSDSRWIKQMISTAGLFESDDFDCEFYAKFCNEAGSWNNVITYGSGTYWTSEMYSDALQWPVGGEIDAFEQNKVENGITTLFTPTAHYGSGSNSSFPDKHCVSQYSEKTEVDDDWHKYYFSLHKGVVTIMIDDIKVGYMDYSELMVNNEHVYNYHPFLKPHAFYIDGSGESEDTSIQYEFLVKDFKIYQKENVKCEKLIIYPQMWGNKNNSFVFPIGAEVFFDREYYPEYTSNKAITWSSSNNAVASVCQGLVKCVGNGSTTIEAKCGNAVTQYEIIVNDNNPNIPCAAIEYKGSIKTYVGAELDVAEIIDIFPLYTSDNVCVYSDNAEIVSTNENSSIIYPCGKGTTELNIVCGNNQISVPIIVGDRLIEEFSASTTSGTYKSNIIGELSSGQTYTWIVDVAKNSDYDGTDFSCNRTSLFNIESNSDNVYPQIMFNTDNEAEILLGNTQKCTIDINEGDRIAIEFSVSGNSDAYVFINGKYAATIEEINPDWFSGERLICIGTTARNAYLTASYSAIYFGNLSEVYTN